MKKDLIFRLLVFVPYCKTSKVIALYSLAACWKETLHALDPYTHLSPLIVLEKRQAYVRVLEEEGKREQEKMRRGRNARKRSWKRSDSFISRVEDTWTKQSMYIYARARASGQKNDAMRLIYDAVIRALYNSLIALSTHR